MKAEAGAKKNKHGMRSVQLIPISFLLLIAVGTLLLMLPVSTSDGRPAGILTALFTSTTSVCVTGLVVVETATYWSFFGKTVILILIQLGGLGIVAVVSGFFVALGKRLSLREITLVRDAFNLDSVRGLTRFLSQVLLGTLIVETAGALLYSIVFIPRFGFGKGVYTAIFTAVSAFCNAGLDVIGGESLATFSGEPLVLIVTMALIVLGGLGYVVWFDVLNHLREGRKHKISFFRSLGRVGAHTKVVTAFTLFLILTGAALIFAFERKNPDTIGSMKIGDQIMNAFFQSITFRTAGFSTFPQESLTYPSVLLGLVFMLIGGSPVGTAGGVKTVTVFLVIANAVAFIRNRNETTAFRRRVSTEMVRKATAIVTIFLLFIAVSTVVLLCIEPIAFENALFETVSATATVGLSRNVTPFLSAPARIVIIIAMYAGRIGPISMALFFTEKRPEENEIRNAEGRFFVG